MKNSKEVNMMNKRIYGLLVNPMLEATPYDKFLTGHGKRKPRSEGKLVGCSHCGKTRCTLYGRGDKKLCKECRTK